MLRALDVGCWRSKAGQMVKVLDARSLACQMPWTMRGKNLLTAQDLGKFKDSIPPFFVLDPFNLQLFVSCPQVP